MSRAGLSAAALVLVNLLFAGPPMASELPDTAPVPSPHALDSNNSEPSSSRFALPDRPAPPPRISPLFKNTPLPPLRDEGDKAEAEAKDGPETAIPMPPTAPLAETPAELCGDIFTDLVIEATVAEPIEEGVCGRTEVLRVNALGTERPIAIAGAPRMSCAMAASLARWLGDTVDPAAQTHLGSPLSRLPAGVSYACRTRNHQPGARLSEHGRANAFDIRAFILEDGREISVLPIAGEDDQPDQNDAGGDDDMTDEGTEPESPQRPQYAADSSEAAFQRTIRAAACGPFKTVLGPGSDAFHDDHLHLDMAERRNRSTYCR